MLLLFSLKSHTLVAPFESSTATEIVAKRLNYTTGEKISFVCLSWGFFLIIKLSCLFVESRVEIVVFFSKVSKLFG